MTVQRPHQGVDPGQRPTTEGERMVAELARNLRRTRRYNATALARDAGRPYATVQRVLSGRQRPSVRLVEDLARAAGVDPWLLYDVPELVDVDDPVPYALTEEALAWLD